VVYLVVVACVLRATTKKGRQLFGEKSAPQRKPSYAYEFAHPWKKILRAPMFPAESGTYLPTRRDGRLSWPWAAGWYQNKCPALALWSIRKLYSIRHIHNFIHPSHINLVVYIFDCNSICIFLSIIIWN